MPNSWGVLSRRLRTQPLRASGIARSNPLANGLVYASLATQRHRNAAALSVDTSISGTKVLANGSPWGTGLVRGFGDSLGRGTDDYINTNFTQHAQLRTYLIFANRNGDGGSGFGRLFDKRVSGAQVETFLYTNLTPALQYTRAWSTASGQWEVNYPGSGWHAIAVTYDAGSVANDAEFYIDGLRHTAGFNEVSTPTGTLTFNSDSYVIGNRPIDNLRNWDGQLGDLFIWDRILSAPEIAEVSLNPWQLYEEPQSSLRYFISSSPPAGGTEYTVYAADGLMMLDPDTRDQQHNLNEQLLLGTLRGLDLSKLVPVDGLLFADNRASERLLQISEGLLLSDARYFDLLLARIDMLMLGDSSLQQVLGSGTLYTVSALDNLFIDEARYFDILIGRLSSLLLYDTGATQVTLPGQVINEVALSDGLLMDDRRLSDLALAIITRMLLADTPYVGAEKAREALDGLLLYAMPRALTLELNATDTALLNDYIAQARSILWSENLLLSEAQATALIGTLIAYLVYARLRGTEFLGIHLAFKDYLGRRIGSTKWRIDL